MIKAAFHSNVKFPEFNFQEDLQFIAKKMFIPSLERYIDNQVAVDESPLLPNSPKYTAWKISQGLSPLILIATGKLRSSFFSADRGKNSVMISLKGDRKKIGGYLMNKGKNFFGVSSRMERNAVDYMSEKIKKIIKNAR